MTRWLILVFVFIEYSSIKINDYRTYGFVGEMTIEDQKIWGLIRHVYKMWWCQAYFVVI